MEYMSLSQYLLTLSPTIHYLAKLIQVLLNNAIMVIKLVVMAALSKEVTIVFQYLDRDQFVIH
jgi:hypothetical protein